MATVQQPTTAPAAALSVEQNGINVIPEAERHGSPRDLFWPWCAANISVLGIGYGTFVLGFGVAFWPAVIAGLAGILFSFFLVGVIALAGRRGSAPTMILSRAGFGVRANGVPAFFSYLLLVGWETVLASLAVLATATVFDRLGWASGTATKLVAFLVVALLIIGAGVLGFAAIMRLQTFITIATAVLTLGYILLTLDHVSWSSVSALPSGGGQAFVGALVFAATAFGLGWINTAADYSRYLPRRAAAGGIVGWTTLGAALPSAVLLLYGLLLAGSNADLAEAVGTDPIGALTTLLPTWYLLPFIVVALLGLVGGAVLDIYSSGLALLVLGLRLPRWQAAAIDGVIMVIGTIYVVFLATDFIGPFQGFLYTVGVPIAAWGGVFLADLLLRRRDYAQEELYVPTGRYGSVNVAGLGAMVVATLLGWGLVTNTFASVLTWQGYLLGPLGLGGKEGDWAYANLGVFVALAVGFLGYLVAGAARVRAQERQPVTAPS